MDHSSEWLGDLQDIPTEDSSPPDQQEEYSEDFIELSQLGYLSKRVNWCGHSFHIKTLNIEEEIATAKLAKQYEETLAQYKVTLTGIVAASIVAIDGIPFLPYIGENDFEQHMQLRFNHVTRWFWPVVEFLTQEHAKLAEQSKQALLELEKKFSGSIKVS